MAFKYVAYNANRQIIRGTIKVPTVEVAKTVLQQSGYSLVSIKPSKVSFDIRAQIPSLFAVKRKDIIAFSKMLATLVGRGINTLVALQLLRDQTGNATFRDILDQIIDDVQGGINLSDAMRKHPEVFSPLYYRTIRVSEQTGNLKNSLNQIAEYMEQESVMRSKIVRALAYPLFVLIVGLGVVGLLMTVTLPALADLFLSLGGDMPLPTRVLVAMTDFINSFILLLVGLPTMGFIGLMLALRNEGFRFGFDRQLLRTPLIGPVILMREVIQFSRTLSTCLAASLSMPDTLTLALETTRNTFVVEAIDAARQQVMQGRSLSQPMAQAQLFPKALVQIVRVGEEAGTLGEDLKTMVEMYELELDRRISTLLGTLSPAIMLLLGGFVAFIALAMVSPIYTVLGQIE